VGGAGPAAANPVRGRGSNRARANQNISLEALVCVRGFSIVYTANFLEIYGREKKSRFDLPVSVLRGCADHHDPE